MDSTGKTFRVVICDAKIYVFPTTFENVVGGIHINIKISIKKAEDSSFI